MRSFLDVLIMPLGSAVLLGCLALILAFRPRANGASRRRAPFVLGAIAVGWLYIASIQPTGLLLMRILEGAYRPMAPEAVPGTDAIFVLGGATYAVRQSDGTLAMEPGPRFEAGMRLMEAGRPGVLVLSGGGSQLPGDPRSGGEHQRLEALRRGVAPERLRLTGPVQTTADEADAIAEMARAEGWRSVTIVTSAWHMGRACTLMEHRGLHTVPFPSEWSAPPPSTAWYLQVLPNLDSLWRTTRALHELVGRVSVRVLGS